jgi:predicted permease
MTWLRAALLRIVGLVRQGDDREIREEFAAHLDLHTAENIRRGMAPDAARRDALIASGGLAMAQELVRERRSVPWLESLGADLRYAIRALRRNPAFATVAVLTLALGIGANTAIFSVVNGVVLRPLAYPDSDRLVALASVLNGRQTSVSPADFNDWQRQVRSISGLAAAYPSLTVLTGDGEPVRFSQARVSANVFDVLALRPVLGRGFAPGEDAADAPRVAMLGERLWRGRFGGDSSIVGRSLVFDGFPTVIIGVAPDELQWPERADVWMTTRFDPEDLTDASRGARWIAVIGRLAGNASLETAQTEMDGVAARLAQLDPRHNENVGTLVTPLRDTIIGDVDRPLFLLLGAVGCVLLIACANVASLTLGRIAARDSELAVRTALGAGRFRIARQVLTESLVVALVGGVVGLALAAAGIRALIAIAPADLPRLGDVTIDGSVLGVTFGLTLLAGVVFGVIPSLHAASADLHHRLRSAGRGAHGARASTRSRRTLVVAEVAIAVVLLAGAGLLLRSFAGLRDVDPGFRSEAVSTFGIALPSTTYGEPAQQQRFTHDLLDRLRRTPGVTDAAVSFALPLSGNNFRFTFDVSGRTTDPQNEPRAQARVASADYFRAMGIPHLRGRMFDERDRLGAPQMLIISAEVARLYFDGEEPLGRYIETGWTMNGKRFGGEVIGVVGDVRQQSLDGDMSPHIYMSHEQWPLTEYEVIVRSTTAPAAIFSAARSILLQLDGDIPLNDARPLADIVDASLGQRRFYMTLLGGFAAVALLLALVGIYGVTAYGVRLRRQEIGVRLALGASRQRVLGMVLSDGLRLAGVGVMVGLVAALLLTKLLESLLFGVGSRDPVTFVIVPLALIGAAVLASLIPARTASRLNPVETIRAD